MLDQTKPIPAAPSTTKFSMKFAPHLGLLSPDAGTASMFPEMFGEDPYDMDPDWRPTGYVWALEGTKGGAV